MENVILSYFKVESEAYQALSELKKLSTFANEITFSQVALIKNVDGKIILKDGFDTGKNTTNDTFMGGLVGSIVGILGGPIGVLLGLGIGATFGFILDANDTKEEATLISSVTSRLKEGNVAIVAVAQEESVDQYNHTLQHFNVTTARYDAGLIQEEIDHAHEVEKQLEKEAHEKIKEKRTKERKEKAAQYKVKIKQEFNELKNKISS